MPNLDSDVSLQYYRVQKAYEGSIKLDDEEGVLNNKTSGTGLPLEDEKDKLSEIIKSLNERLGTNFTEMDTSLFLSLFGRAYIRQKHARKKIVGGTVVKLLIELNKHKLTVDEECPGIVKL